MLENSLGESVPAARLTLDRKREPSIEERQPFRPQEDFDVRKWSDVFGFPNLFRKGSSQLENRELLIRPWLGRVGVPKHRLSRAFALLFEYEGQPIGLRLTLVVHHDGCPHSAAKGPSFSPEGMARGESDHGGS